MRRLYYKIWVDAIASERSKKIEGKNWKLYTIIPISILQGINLLTFFYWMKVLVNRNLPLFMIVNVFNAKPLNSFISIVITFILPFVILNYLLVFNNDRYKKLMTLYNNRNGKLYKRYALITIGLLIIPTLIVKLYF